MFDVLLAVDPDDANFERQYPIWERHGVALHRVFSMPDALEALQSRSFLAVGINADLIDYAPMLGMVREAATSPIHVIRRFYDSNEHTRSLKLGADVFGVWSENPEDNVFRGITMINRYHSLSGRRKNTVPAVILNDVCLFPDHHRIFVGNAEVDLRPKEFRILQMLMENHNCILTHEQILERVWGQNYPDSSVGQLWSQVKNLRSKLMEASNGFDYILSIKGFGYRFVIPDDVLAIVQPINI